jgi:uncharacterized protein YbbC (DUF1343 family)
VGAPWFDAQGIANEVNAAAPAGVRVYATKRTPASSHFAGQEIPGLQVLVTDRDAFSSMRFGLTLASAILRAHPSEIDLEQTLRLLGRADSAAALERGESIGEIWEYWESQVREFETIRNRYLLYPR